MQTYQMHAIAHLWRFCSCFQMIYLHAPFLTISQELPSLGLWLPIPRRGPVLDQQIGLELLPSSKQGLSSLGVHQKVHSQGFDNSRA